MQERVLKIAVIDDEKSARDSIKRFLEKDGFRVETYADGLSFLRDIRANPCNIALIDLQLPDINGLDVLEKLKELYPDVEAVIITGHGSIETAVDATRKGAFHYLTKPCRKNDICTMVDRVKEKIFMRDENHKLQDAMHGDGLIPGFVGASPAMQEIFKIVQKVAMVNCNVLLEAETGTGKQVVAKAIHELSQRKKKPFVYFNCGGFTEELICSELFGHERGAFTGATSTKKGLFETASGGTVLLDEIGEMSMSMQVKLLHVLQERQIIRVGGNRAVDLDIRIIAATNRDLKRAIDQGAFREDLYYRLNVVRIQLPRLSDRKDDIPLLVAHFIRKFNVSFDKQVENISPSAMKHLMRYSFPGNVRELENMIQRAVALSDGSEITLKDLPQTIRDLAWGDVDEDTLIPLEEVEKQHISKVLEKTGYNKKLASTILKVPRTTLWRRMKQFGLDRKGDN